MATANNNLTVMDHIRRTDPNGGIAPIIEAITKFVPVIEDAVFKEGNLPDGHEFSARSSLPVVGRRRYNKGTPGDKSGNNQVKEPTTSLVVRSIVDEKEADRAGNKAAFLASEQPAFVEAMVEKADSAMLYDNKTTDPDQATGLLPRLDSTTGDAGKQIVLWSTPGVGVSHTCTSLIFVGWGDNTVHGIFPKGSMAGLSHKPMPGVQLIPDSNGDLYRAYVSDWEWDIGVAVKDKRYLAAVRNIDMAVLTDGTHEGTAAAPINDLVRAAVKAFYKIKNPAAVKGRWYATRDLAMYLHLQALSATSHTLRVENPAGSPPLTMLCGFPLRISDSITATEDSIA